MCSKHCLPFPFLWESDGDGIYMSDGPLPEPAAPSYQQHIDFLFGSVCKEAVRPLQSRRALPRLQTVLMDMSGREARRADCVSTVRDLSVAQTVRKDPWDEKCDWTLLAHVHQRRSPTTAMPPAAHLLGSEGRRLGTQESNPSSGSQQSWPAASKPGEVAESMGVYADARRAVPKSEEKQPRPETPPQSTADPNVVRGGEQELELVSTTYSLSSAPPADGACAAQPTISHASMNEELITTCSWTLPPPSILSSPPVDPAVGACAAQSAATPYASTTKEEADDHEEDPNAEEEPVRPEVASDVAGDEKEADEKQALDITTIHRQKPVFSTPPALACSGQPHPMTLLGSNLKKLLADVESVAPGRKQRQQEAYFGNDAVMARVLPQSPGPCEDLLAKLTRRLCEVQKQNVQSEVETHIMNAPAALQWDMSCKLADAADSDEPPKHLQEADTISLAWPRTMLEDAHLGSAAMFLGGADSSTTGSLQTPKGGFVDFSELCSQSGGEDVDVTNSSRVSSRLYRQKCRKLRSVLRRERGAYRQFLSKEQQIIW